MATLESLVAAIAEVEGIGAERVRALARALREAGLIATGGRGTSAADMSETDAANLLIAANVADTARTAAEMVNRYRGLRASPSGNARFGSEFDRLLLGVSTGRMAASVANLVRLAPNPSPLVSHRYELEQYEIMIRFEKPIPGVTIYVTAPRGESHVDTVKFSQRTPSVTILDRRIEVSITERTIFAVGPLLRN